MSQKVYERITNLITEKMEGGIVPWKRPWSGASAQLGEHKNEFTGKPYRGINAILAYASGYDSPLWLTYKQAKDKGLHVKKGEKGTPIVFWNWVQKKQKDEGDSELDSKQKLCPFLRTYTIFNAYQIEGLEVKTSEDNQDQLDFRPIEKAEQLLKGFTDAPKVIQKQQRAFYNKFDDLINMPRKASFNSVDEYYSTLFHELGHSTGHERRLNRKTLNEINSFGDHSYSKEELVAELSSAFLCSICGISSAVIDNQVAYIDGWLTSLRKNPKLFIEAAQKAQKSVDYITSKGPFQEGPQNA